MSHILGTKVKDPQGTSSGHIRDFVFARDTGQIKYTIVSYGGVFGIGSRYAAVPPTDIELQPGQKLARLSVDHSALVASSFSPMRWPDLSSPSFEQRTARLYGIQPGGAVLGYVPPESNVTVEPRANVHNPVPQQTPAPTPEYNAPTAIPPSAGTMTFNPSEVKTIEGTIVDTGRLRMVGPGMLGLRLKTAGGRIVLVNLGPRDYISHQDFMVVDGDHVAITGADATIGGRPVFVATQVSRAGHVLKLRDSSGHPLWLQATSADENAGVGTSVYGESSTDRAADLDQ